MLRKDFPINRKIDDIFGGPGNDTVKGDAGRDELWGDGFFPASKDGNDRLWDSGWDTAYTCGGGFDRASNQIWVLDCEAALTSEP